MPTSDELFKAILKEAPELEKHVPVTERWSVGHPIEIMRAIDANLPEDWDQWEFPVIFKEVEKKFGEIDTVIQQKIMAIVSCRTTNRPWHDYDIFENTCISFFGGVPIFGELEPLDLHEMAFGIGCMNAIQPNEEFGEEVLGYIGATCVYNSLYISPPIQGADVIQNVIKRLYPEVDNLLLQMRQILMAIDVQNVDINEDPESIEELQLQKLHVYTSWYNLGRFWK